MKLLWPLTFLLLKLIQIFHPLLLITPQSLNFLERIATFHFPILLNV